MPENDGGRRVTVLMRLLDADENEVHAMNLQHPKFKLNSPLSALVDKFIRHSRGRQLSSSEEVQVDAFAGEAR